MSTAELAVSYAALILADDGVEISVGNLRHGNQYLLTFPTGRQAQHYYQGCQRP